MFLVYLTYLQQTQDGLKSSIKTITFPKPLGANFS